MRARRSDDYLRQNIKVMPALGAYRIGWARSRQILVCREWPHLDVAPLDLQGVPLQRPVVVHEIPEEGDRPDRPNFPIRTPTLEGVNGANRERDEPRLRRRS